MLTYDTCIALKGAGYPQTGSMLHMDDGGRILHEYEDDTDAVACPNSDELLAAMQERWPNALDHLRPETPPYTYWIAPSTLDDQIKGVGETLADALAALYIALAEAAGRVAV